MSKKDKYALYRREWLNLKGHHSIAFVYTKLSKADIYKEGTKDASASVDGAVSIGDCSRAVFLDLSAYSLEEASNTLYKLNKLIRALERCKRAYKKEIAKARTVWDAHPLPSQPTDSSGQASDTVT